MTPSDQINYTPPPTIAAFIKDYRPGELFYDWIVGPVGSGKTTGIFFKLVRMAKMQKPGPDGIRRTRAVVVRNTAPQLRDTTLTSWSYWFKDGQAGRWRATDKNFILRFDDVECEVMFRPLDTPDDVARVLSLEVTFAIIDEFVQIPQEIINALSSRVGRYPPARDGGATNWGIWGSSNPDTEDNWWFDYLHNRDIVKKYGEPNKNADSINATYFLQPSGFAPNAENIENLPGGQGYYDNQRQGKSEAWVKQFLEAEWGFSIAGQPVVPTFRSDLHVAKTRLKFNPLRKLVVGLDPGVGNMSAILGQEDEWGRLLVFAELIASGYGAQRFVTDKLRPFLNMRFPNADVLIAPDPAAANRAQTDEKTVVSILQKYYPVSIEQNNRLPLRLDAIEHYSTRLTDVGPALQIDPEGCPVLIRALKGGWRYVLDPKKGVVRGSEPEKNSYSHPGDGFGYLCRYYHRAGESARRAKAFNIDSLVGHRRPGNPYHVR